MTTDWSKDETDDPTYADRRNFYKVEKWSRDGLRVELMLYAGVRLQIVWDNLSCLRTEALARLG